MSTVLAILWVIFAFVLIGHAYGVMSVPFVAAFASWLIMSIVAYYSGKS